MKEFKIHSVETVSEESQKSNVKIVVKQKKRGRKIKRIKKHTSPDGQFETFSLTKQKLDLERTMTEMGKPYPKKSDEKTENQSRRL